MILIGKDVFNLFFSLSFNIILCLHWKAKLHYSFAKKRKEKGSNFFENYIF